MGSGSAVLFRDQAVLFFWGGGGGGGGIRNQHLPRVWNQGSEIWLQKWDQP